MKRKGRRGKTLRVNVRGVKMIRLRNQKERKRRKNPTRRSLRKREERKAQEKEKIKEVYEDGDNVIFFKEFLIISIT